MGCGPGPSLGTAFGGGFHSEGIPAYVEATSGELSYHWISSKPDQDPGRKFVCYRQWLQASQVEVAVQAARGTRHS